jgi:hypothetical protein
MSYVLIGMMFMVIHITVHHSRTGEFHDPGDNVEKIILLINSNLNHQIHPEGGWGLAARRAYRYDPLTDP